MKKIIDGKRYDTGTAEELATLPCEANGHSDFSWHHTSVYRTRNGRFFLAGEGGPMTMWARPVGANCWTGGRDINAISADDARDYLERCGADGMAAIEKYFDVEDA